jgi:hypothetical protein
MRGARGDRWPIDNRTELERKIARTRLEQEVFELDFIDYSAPADFAKLSDADLYGMRDRARREAFGSALLKAPPVRR